MRHRVANRKLGRVTEHRIALLRSLSTDLLRHEHIETTVPKAKELRPFVERIITIAKRGIAGSPEPVRAMNARRLVLRDIHDEQVVSKLFSQLAPRFAERPGGYTRLLRIGFRRGDSAELAQVELIGSEFNPKAAAEKAAKEKAGGAPKAKGVGGRLRAAADRLRGKKAAEESEDAAATDAEVKSQARAAARKGSGGSRRAPGGRGAKGK